MKKVLPLFLLILFCLSSFGQEKDKCITFILLIDGELPTTTDITDGTIIFNDSAGIKKDEISFDFHVGRIQMSLQDYKKLFSIDAGNRIFIRFKYKKFYPKYAEYAYEKEIPNGWFNKDYMIFKIYNAFNKAARARYFFKHGEKYLIQIKIPGSSTLLITRK